MSQADLLIKNGLILTLDDNFTVLPQGDIVINQGQISEISAASQTKAAQIIDASGQLVMPGLINTHTHAAMTLLRGAADDLPLDIWWHKVIFPLEKKFVSPEFVRIGAALAILEMIKSGTTSFLDMYFFSAETAEICRQFGIRAWLGEAIMDFPTPSCKSAEETLNYVRAFANHYRADPLITPVIAPHAPYTCNRENLLKAKALADQLNLPLNMHVAETAEEVANLRLQTGLTPVVYLEKLGLLCRRLSAVHCVHLTTEEIKLLAHHQVKVCHCGESNMKLASGNAPIVELLQAGVTIGLGTDGAASNNNLDLFDEMDVVAKLHKAIKHDPLAINAKTALGLATTQAAKVLLRPDLGSLIIGNKADIILLNLNTAHLTPLYNPYSHLVYSAGGSDVSTVIINGKVIMKDRRLITIDETEVLTKARELAVKIGQSLPRL
ncbi:hypothetical protein A2311_05490 [candidate division WOR-1 bacterium RIFOXYB2_FULL_48_7]|uniref:5-methylthioadenosine/S-adenosylhomocysteine deaminase n=1 Tax=candidate division WOR-1 bacterium RIFOXYB2_FULL_48_7 TaxID=1802583 RepID=A0A1F4TK48_UNCSA|nr:MAG: hypothetical protein A2311_05490 [candidate division WOR-1 bacterium RIFOXYB2_FULL_48_7]